MQDKVTKNVIKSFINISIFVDEIHVYSGF